MTDIEEVVDRFFCEVIPTPPGDNLLVAYSGGADSTALLAAALEIGRARNLRVHAGHVDHGLDADSAERARRAGERASALGATFHLHTLSPTRDFGRCRGLEHAARQARYAVLATVRKRLGARALATAHHRGDQAETVVLRASLGSGLRGLTAMRPLSFRIGRPLLDTRAADLVRYLEARGIGWETDPTNLDVSLVRNRIRHHVLARLSEPGAPPEQLERRLCALARSTQQALARVDTSLEGLLRPRRLTHGIAVDRGQLLALPDPLLALALGRLHELAGAPYPGTRQARRELRRQNERGGAVGIDCGGGWRWESRGSLLLVRRPWNPKDPGA